MKRKMVILWLIYFVSGVSLGIGQQQNDTFQLTAQVRQTVITDVVRLLDENYIFPDVAKKMGVLIQKRLQEGAYDKLSDPEEFCSTVVKDMRSISKDKHLNLAYSPEEVQRIRKFESRDESQKKEAQQKYLKQLQKDNFGFRKVERLDGNIGYLDFRFFASADLAGETATAAMNYLSYSDAVIIDLRENGGGDPSQIQLISSYFFKQPTHLNDIYSRRDNVTENYWTLPYVPGHIMPDTDLYVLTSGYTFSGAEEFAYNMKNLKRATLVGEVTGGGAHPVDNKIVQDKFVLRVPYARAINPISKTNWEGTGVTPDVAVPADEAFDKAYSMALQKLSSRAKNPEEKQQWEWILAGAEGRAKHIALDEAAMKLLVGVYEERKITLENGQLYYQRTDARFKLIPLSPTLFAIDEDADFRVEFALQNNKAVEVIGLYSDGRKEPSKRTQ